MAPPPMMKDLDGMDLKVGDFVEAYRYELGPSKLIQQEGQLFYASLETGKTVSWTKMIDAASRCQKVRKVSK